MKSVDWYTVVPAILVALLFAAEWLRGVYSGTRMSRNDKWLNAISVVQDVLLVRPFVACVVAFALGALLPAYRGSLSGLPFWPALIVFFLGQDLIHYWFHRQAHAWPWLWNIHRTHHSATAMSVAVTPRLNFLWQVLLPINYTAGAAIYLGLIKVYAVWWAFRAVLNFLTHTAIRWDLPLYRVRWLRPCVWLVEHTFTTPDAHHAHHGYGRNGNPAGNFAPVMIFWDFVFGTARLPHEAQEKIGIEDDPHYPWYQQLWWPLFPLSRSRERR